MSDETIAIIVLSLVPVIIFLFFFAMFKLGPRCPLCGNPLQCHKRSCPLVLNLPITKDEEKAFLNAYYGENAWRFDIPEEERADE